MKNVVTRISFFLIAIVLSSCMSWIDPMPSERPPDSALHKAVLRNDAASVTSQIHSPFTNINKLSRGRTALAYAVEKNNYQIAKILLENGANPNIQSTVTGIAPLFDAANDGNLPMVKLLVNHGADPNQKGAFKEYDHTPIWAASNNHHQAVVSYLKSVKTTTSN